VQRSLTAVGGFPSGYHQLVAGSDGLCLDADGNTTATGAAIDQWTLKKCRRNQPVFTPQLMGRVAGLAGPGHQACRLSAAAPDRC
jgi:hypothetical protein